MARTIVRRHLRKTKKGYVPVRRHKRKYPGNSEDKPTKASLKEYNKKRDFRKTKEPKSKNKLNEFVVQEHDATNKHWDLRLPSKGVLESWAIPKNPKLATKKKLLAIKTEDHPLDYADFEGKIPEGEYGAGIVKIWDKGKFKFINLDDDIVEIELKGKKLKGKYNLVNFNGPGKWLFFKGKEKENGSSKR